MFLGVPGDAVRRFRGHVDLKGDRVVFYVALLRVQHVVPRHEVGETPVILLAVQHIRKYFSNNIGTLPEDFERHWPVPWKRVDKCLVNTRQSFMCSERLDKLIHKDYNTDKGFSDQMFTVFKKIQLFLKE